MHARDCLFRGAKMSCAKGRFHNCDFTMVNARDECFGQELVDCNFTGAYLIGCTMFGRYVRCDFTGADLWNAPIDSGDAVHECNLTDARVRGDFGPWRSLKYGFPLDPSDAMS